jgi:hypothetical protein
MGRKMQYFTRTEKLGRREGDRGFEVMRISGVGMSD